MLLETRIASKPFARCIVNLKGTAGFLLLPLPAITTSFGLRALLLDVSLDWSSAAVCSCNGVLPRVSRNYCSLPSLLALRGTCYLRVCMNLGSANATLQDLQQYTATPSPPVLLAARKHS